MQADVQTMPRSGTLATPLAIAYSTTLWLKLAVVYLIVGVGLGIAMGVSHTFTLRPVQARIHFWLHNIALPVMMGSLAVLLLGNEAVVPILGISEILAAAGVLVFAANVF